MNVLREYCWAVSDDTKPLRAILVQVLMPIAFGGIALLPGGARAFQSQIVTVVAIVTSLLFGMLVLLIDLRGRVRRGEDPRAIPGDRDSNNLDYAYYSTNYTIVVGFIVCALLLIQERLSPLLVGVCAIASDWLIYSLTATFTIAAFHCLKRLRRCYEVFGKGNS